MQGSRFRADIEGLRAVAVVPVVLFHAAVAPFGGGFLGVDVFFVISGFLITGILVREIEAGEFSLLGFYRRRVARILPALLTVIGVVLFAGLWLLLPGEMRVLGRSAAAAAAFASNLFFWRHQTYFAEAAETQPLLHTWSIAIEEQYYLLYPLFVLVCMLRGRSLLLTMLAAGTLASMVLAAWLARTHPEPAFYLLPSRAWELGLGGLTALVRPFRLTGPRTREILCAAAAAALAASFCFTSIGWGVPFPAGLAPCFATAILLRVGEGSTVSRLLSARPLCWIGRLSYSLYLWHWPILSFYRMWFGFALSPVEQLVLIAAAFLLAILSYRLVERPLRGRLRRARSGRVVAGGVAAAAAIAVAAWVLGSARWHFTAFPAPVLRTDAARNQMAGRFREPRADCSRDGEERTFQCLRFAPGRRNVLVIGDSHAAHLWPALRSRFPDIHFLASLQNGCRPVLGASGSRQCRDRVVRAFALARQHPADGVLLAARWHRDDLDELGRTISDLRRRGIAVTVVGPVVEYAAAVPGLLARAQLLDDRSWIDRSRMIERERLDREMGPLVRGAGGAYFSAYRQECPPGRSCRLFTRSGLPLHHDYGHYTPEAAREIVAALPPP